MARTARHTAKSLLSPEVPLSADALVIEMSRALKRVQKNPLLGREQILAELAPSAARVHKLAEALEKQRERPVKVALREVEEDEPEVAVVAPVKEPVDDDDPMDGMDFADVDGDEGDAEAAS